MNCLLLNALGLFAAILGHPLLSQTEATGMGQLRGAVIAKGYEELPLGSLQLKNKVFERTFKVSASFEIDFLPPGQLEATLYVPGFQPQTLQVTIRAGETTAVRFELTPQVFEVSEVVVAPGTVSLFRRPLRQQRFFDRETIRNTPHFNDDVLRAMETLPGVSSYDFGAAFSVRGGESREVAMTLDGMDIIAPYHLKDLTGVFSYFDPEVLGGLRLSTGGYSAKFGNAMSGVLEMETVEPQYRRTIAGISFGNVSFQAEGRFANGLGSYLVSGRRGYLDLLLSLSGGTEEDEDSDITYYDTLGKISYAFHPNHRLQLNYLLAGDAFVLKDLGAEDPEDTESDYQDFYTWITWETQWSERVKGRLKLFHGDLDQERDALESPDYDAFDFRDDRSLSFLGVGWDWEWRLNPGHFLQWGMGYRSVDATYDFDGVFSSAFSITDRAQERVIVSRAVEGEDTHAYVTDRFRVSEAVIMELGVRFDHQTLQDESQVSPRLNFTYQGANQQTFRLAVGSYHQAEQAHELQVADGVDAFSKAEEALHYLFSFDKGFDTRVELRLETYYKDIRQPRIRYENLTRSLSRYPGGSQDRIRIDPDGSEMYGAEVSLKQNLTGSFSWFFSYAWSRAQDEVAGQTLRRQRDQEHSIHTNLSYRPGKKWSFNAAWVYHTGWRTTPIDVGQTESGPTLVIGEWFSETFPAYHRLDLRLNRVVFADQRRSFQLYIDLFNAYDRANVRSYENYEILEGIDGQPKLEFSTEEWLPLLPSFGLSWQF